MIHYDMRCTTIIIYDNWKFQFNSHWIPLFILFVMMMMMMRKIVIFVFFYFNCRKFLSLPVFSIDKNLSTLLPLSLEFHWESICFIYFLYHSLLMKEWVNLNRWKKSIASKKYDEWNVEKYYLLLSLFPLDFRFKVFFIVVIMKIICMFIISIFINKNKIK